MELMEAIRSRRTVRTFRPDPVPDQILNDILEAGTWAPSHSNTQPWEFIVIGPATRERLAKSYRAMIEAGPLQNPALPEERKQAMRNFAQDFGGAPLLFSVAYPPPTTDLDRYDFPLAAAAALQNIFLAAWEKQLAGVWLSFGISPEAQSLLELQSGGSIAGIVAMGYTDNIPPAQPRVPVSGKIRRMP